MSESIEAYARQQPKDTLVITSKRRLTLDQINDIRTKLQAQLPNQRFLILDGDLQAEVLRG